MKGYLLFLGGVSSLAAAQAQLLDCHPGAAHDEDDSTIQATCTTFGCNFNAAPTNPLAPKCTYPAGYGYTSTDSFTGDEGTASLTPHTSTQPRYLNSVETGMPDVILEVQREGADRVRFYFNEAGRTGNDTRYEIPDYIVKLNEAPFSSDESRYEVRFAGTSAPGGSFLLELNRRIPADEANNFPGSTTNIFLADLPGFAFQEQFIEISFRLPNDTIYGFGEHEHTSLKHQWDYFYLPMFTRAHGVMAHNDRNEYPNLYGHHPFFMGFDSEGFAYGVLFWNSNAQEVFLQPDNIMTFRTIGGVLDMRVMLGPSPTEVLQQYHTMIGTPYFPPYWSLGFQLCKYWYGSLDVIKALTDRMIKHDLYWDVQQLDIDYMDRQRAFTSDTDGVSFVGLREHIKRLQEEEMGFMKAVVILDPAITANDTIWECNTQAPDLPPTDNPPMDLRRLDAAERYERFDNRMLQQTCDQQDPDYHAWVAGVAADIFVKLRTDNYEYNMGKVWPEYPNATKEICHRNTYDWDPQVAVCRSFSAWPDWGLKATEEWWVQECLNFHAGGRHDGYDYGEGVPFDGIWIDMNEPENFIKGSNNHWGTGTAPSTNCANTDLENPPYTPHLADRHEGLSIKTTCMEAVQRWDASNSTNPIEHTMYNTHSLYGHSMAIPTLAAATAVREGRSMVFSRSSFAGTGALIGHWLGDNETSWAALKRSIIGMLEFNIFGITYTGVDVCGFFHVGGTQIGNPEKTDRASPELCYRWQQVAAFYTFSRNHSTKYKNEQDPAMYAEDAGEGFARAFNRAYRVRYEMMPYLYTNLYQANRLGGTVVRSMFEEFWRDRNTWDMDEQFLWGSGLMIAPILHEGQTVKEVYLPAGRWYDRYTHEEKLWEQRTVARSFNFTSPIENFEGDIPVFYRGGYIFPQQVANRTLHNSRLNPMFLVVALDDEQKASGHLHWDTGESLVDAAQYPSLDCYFSFESNVFTSVAISQHGFSAGLNVNRIIVIGYLDWIDQIVSNGIVRQATQNWQNRELILDLNPVPIDETFSIKIYGHAEVPDAAVPRHFSTLATIIFSIFATVYALMPVRY